MPEIDENLINQKFEIKIAFTMSYASKDEAIKLQERLRHTVESLDRPLLWSASLENKD